MISETTVGIQTLIGVVQVLASVIAAVASAFAVKWAKEAVDQMRLNAQHDKIQHLIDTQRDARQYLELFFKSYVPSELVPQQQAPNSSEFIGAIRNMSSLFKLLKDNHASSHFATLASALSEMTLIPPNQTGTNIVRMLNNITQEGVTQFYWDAFDVKHPALANGQSIKEIARELTTTDFPILTAYYMCCVMLVNDFASARIQLFLQSNPA
jgi:hypothetical protein